MKITKVSMGGVNDNLSTKDVLDFLCAYPNAELGISLSQANASMTIPYSLRHKYKSLWRYTQSLLEEYDDAYFKQWWKTMRYDAIGGLVLDINDDTLDFPYSGGFGWAYDTLTHSMPKELIGWSGSAHSFPLRLQLNPGRREVPITAAQGIGQRGYFADMWRLPLANFILVLPYCKKTKEFWDLFRQNADIFNGPHYEVNPRKEYDKFKWEILYDESHGTGKVAQEYGEPVDYRRSQGYAGGFGVDNITTELEKIYTAITQYEARILTEYERVAHMMDDHAIEYWHRMRKITMEGTPIWISAKSKLLADDGETLDLGKAEQFYKKVMEFAAQHTK